MCFEKKIFRSYFSIKFEEFLLILLKNQKFQWVLKYVPIINLVYKLLYLFNIY